MYLCVTATSRKCLVHWAIIEAEMLTSPFPIYLLNLARFLSTSTLPIGVSTPCRWSEIFLCVSETSKNHLVHGALTEAEMLTYPLPMYLLNLAQFWSLALCPQVCWHLPSGLKMFLCVTGTSRKCLVHGTIIEAEILTSPLPIYLLNLAKLLGTSTLPTGVSTPPRWSKIFLYVSGTSKKHLVHEALTEAEILTYPLPMYLLNLAQFWSLALYLQVWQHLSHGLEMILHVWETSKEHFVHGALIEAEILTSPLPHVFAQLGLVYGCKCSAHWCVTTPSGLKTFLCVTGTSRKCLVHGVIIEAEILTSPFPIYLLNLAKFLGTSTLPAGVATPPTWSRNDSSCLRNLQRTFCAWCPNRSWDIDLPTPPCICSTWPGLWVQVLCPLVCQHPKWSKNVSMCHRNLQKMFGAWGHNRSWDIDLPTPHIFA